MKRFYLFIALILCCWAPAQAQFVPTSPQCPTVSSAAKIDEDNYWTSRGFTEQYGFYRCTGANYGLYVIYGEQKKDNGSFDLYLITAGRVSSGDKIRLDALFQELLGLSFDQLRKLPDNSEIRGGPRLHRLGDAFLRIAF